jgi:hypothetical protein
VLHLSVLSRVDKALRPQPIGLGIFACQINPRSTVRAEDARRVERGGVEHHGWKPGVTVIAKRLVRPQIVRQTLKPDILARPFGIHDVRRTQGRGR